MSGPAVHGELQHNRGHGIRLIFDRQTRPAVGSAMTPPSPWPNGARKPPGTTVHGMTGGDCRVNMIVLRALPADALG
jgi:hypothetical protein